MTRCEYITLDCENCHNEALPEEKYCYWHLKTKSKKPTIEQVQELKHKFIIDIYLEKANLEEADLQRADLKRANLSGANLQEADLLGANLQEAKLQGANLSEALLFEAKLLKANLQGANLSEVKLLKANLQGANLKEANLQGANLKEANLQEANLIFADIQEADLVGANLKEANLTFAKLREVNLQSANLQGANLSGANLQGANLSGANLQGANLSGANLQEADLSRANLQEADLSKTKLQGANFYGTIFNSKTNFNDSNLTGSNLFRSYFDIAKSFRNIEKYFENKGDKEINEIVGDTLKSNNILRKICRFSFINKLNSLGLKILKIKTLPLNFKPIILNYKTIEKNKPDIGLKLRGKGMFRYAGQEDKIIFVDIYREVLIKNPENGKNRIEFEEIPELTNCIFKDNLLLQDYLFQGKPDFYYEASYEVYNYLYNFYITNGRLDKAAEVHYRREEVNRKLRWEKGIWSKFRSIFDLLVVRGLTGYGDKIERPFIFSSIFILLFAVLFKLTDGIVKTVNGNIVEPDCIDYLYHSITTFTSLGYSNIQPNLAIGHLPQILVSIESGLGIMMMALIIFVITYQVSR